MSSTQVEVRELPLEDIKSITKGKQHLLCHLWMIFRSVLLEEKKKKEIT